MYEAKLDGIDSFQPASCWLANLSQHFLVKLIQIWYQFWTSTFYYWGGGGGWVYIIEKTQYLASSQRPKNGKKMRQNRRVCFQLFNCPNCVHWPDARGEIQHNCASIQQRANPPSEKFHSRGLHKTPHNIYRFRTSGQPGGLLSRRRVLFRLWIHKSISLKFNLILIMKRGGVYWVGVFSSFGENAEKVLDWKPKNWRTIWSLNLWSLSLCLPLLQLILIVLTIWCALVLLFKLSTDPKLQLGITII